MKTILTFLLSSIISVYFNAQNGTLDPTFGIDGKVATQVGTFNDRGNGIAIQTDQKILIAGQSYGVSQKYMTVLRYNPDGSVDTTFANAGVATIDFGTTGSAGNAIALQSDGKIVIGGNNNSDFAIARLNSNGALDNTFGTNGLVNTKFGTSSYQFISALKILSNDKILAVGTVSISNFDIAMAKYNVDGTLDTTFGNNGKVTTAHPNGLNEYGNAIAIQNDNKIVVAGTISPGGTNDFQTIRYNPDGTLDLTFNYNGKVITDFGTTVDAGNTVAIQNDQKILVGGSSSDGIISKFSMARYNTDGSLDLSFDSDGKVFTEFTSSSAYGNALAINNDKIFLAGNSSFDNNNFAMASYNVDGSLDSTFGLGGKITTDFNTNSDQSFAIAFQADGKIILGGSTSDAASYTAFAMARYNYAPSTLQTHNIANQSFSVFPNPTTSYLNIKNDKSEKIISISILDVSGRKIMDFTENQKIINVESLNAGLYILIIKTEKETKQLKFLKK